MSLEHAPQRQARPDEGAGKPKTRHGTILEPLLTTEELAALLNVTPEVLRAARTHGTGAFANLRWHKIGRIVRYHPRDVADWLAAHERGHPA
jgi:hypothetical protein